MAEEFKISLGLEFKAGELENIRNQINNIQTNPIELRINTQNVQQQINNIRRQLQNLGNIRINLTGNNGGNGVQRTVNEITRAYNDLMNLSRRINSIRIQMNGLDSNKNSGQISELSNQLNRLMADYNNLYQMFNRNFSTNQIDNLNRAFDTANGKISSLNAKMSDNSAVKQTESAYKELLNVAKQMGNLELKIGGLELIGNDESEITRLKNQLEELRAEYISLFNTLKGKLSESQLSVLSDSVYKVQDKLNLLAGNITGKINTGAFQKEIATLESKFSKLSASGKAAVGNLDSVKNAFSKMTIASSTGDIDGLIAAYKEYKLVLQEINNQIDINTKKEKEQANANKLANDKTALSQQMDMWLKNNSAAAKQFGGRIKELQSELKGCDATRLSGIKSEFQNLTREATMAGKATQTFGDKFKAQFDKLSVYLSTITLMTYAITALKDAYNNIVEIDSSMVELKKVTDETNASYQNFLNSSGNTAKDIGTNISDYISSTADFARLGYTFKESQELAKTANIYSVVGDDIDNVNTATQSIISTMKAFKVETNDSMSIVDKFNEIGNRFAISSGGIGEAMTRSASSMAAVNNTLDETIALITAANTVVQDPDSVGTAFKTISMRIRGAKTELEDAGLETDGMAESTAKLREEIKALSGVDIMIDNDTFKSTYQIFDELSAKWQQLTDIQQASITELIAGKRQGNIVSSLMTNFDIARQAVGVSAGSEGSATREHEKWMDSLEAKTKQLEAAWQSLSKTFLSSDFLKVTITGLTGFVSALESVVDTLGTLGTITATISIFNILKDKSLVNNTVALAKALFSSKTEFDGLMAASDNFTNSFKSFIKSPAGIVTSIGLITTAISTAISAYQNWKQEQEQARLETLETNNSILDSIDTFEQVYVKFSGKDSLTSSEEEELSSAIEGTVSALGDKAGALANATQAQNGYLDSLQETATEEIAAAERIAKENFQAAKDQLKSESWDGFWGSQATIDLSGRTGVDEFVKAKEVVEELMGDYIDMGAYGEELEPLGWDTDHTNMENLVDYYYKLTDLKNTLIDKGLTENDIYADAKSKVDGLSESVNEYLTQQYNALKYEYQAQNGIPKTVEEYENMRESILGNIEASDRYKQAIKGIMDSEWGEVFDLKGINTRITDAGKQAVENYKQVLSEAVKAKVDFDKTVYGNIDTNNRQAITWDDSNIQKYGDALKSWGVEVDNIKDSISTVFGGSDEFDGIEIAFSPMLQTENGAELLDKDTVYKYINSLIDKAGEGWTNEDLFKLDTEGIDINGKHIQGLLADIGETAIQTGEAMHFVGNQGAVALAFDEVSKAAEEAGISVGELIGQYNILSSSDFSLNIKAETEGMDKFYAAIKESVASTGLAGESIDALKSRYQSLANYNESDLFEKTTNGIHLNVEALRELESAYEKQKGDEVYGHLEDLVNQYNMLTEAIDRSDDATETAKLYSQRDNILNQINDTATLAAQYESLTSAFYKWEQAQSAGEEGDMYDSLSGGLENIKKLYDDGLVGTNEFRAAVQLMSNQDLSTANIEELVNAYNNGYSKITRYFTEGSEGCNSFLSDVSKLNSEWAHMNEDGSWEINFGIGNDQEIADKLGISVDAVQAIMRKLSDYGFDINLDSPLSSLDKLKTEAEEANNKLKELGKTDYTFNFNTDNADDLNEQISKAQSLVDTFKYNDGVINLKLEGATEAQTILASLIYQKQSLEKTTIMNVDTSNVDESSSGIEQAVAKLQEFKTAYNDLNLKTAIGLDTTEAQSKVNNLLAEMSKNTEITGSLKIDTTSVDTAITSINALTPEVLVEVGIDSSLIAGYNPEDKEGTVKYDVDSSAVDNYHPENKDAWVTYNLNSSEVDNYYPQDRVAHVKYVVDGEGVGGVDGTAHVTGTAFAKGSWGTKDSGVALGGELGTELLVRNGKYITIGEDSAEFFRYKKGDIIFNAAQTKEIFEKGKITHGSRRGRALAEGTAFSTGSGKFYGGASTTNKNKNNKNTKTTTTTTTSTTTTTTKDNKSSDKETKTNENYYNYFEAMLENRKKAIEKYEKELENLNTKMEEALENNDIELFESLQESYGNKSTEYRNYLAKSADEMRSLAEEQIYPIVYKFAPELEGQTIDNWDEKTILDIQKRIDDELIKLENSQSDSKNKSDDKKTKELEYKRKEYEALKDTLSDLSDVVGNKNGEGEWAEKWAENLKEWKDNCLKEFDEIQEGYERTLENINNKADTIDNHISLIEAQGYEANDILTRQLIENKEQEKAILEEEKAQLQTKLEELVAIGAIIEGSDEYYERLKAINDIDLEITEGKIDIAKYTKELDGYDRHVSIFEKALERLNDTFQKISSMASSAYKSFTSKSDYMTKEAEQMRSIIKANNDELALLQERLDSLNLPDDLMQAIINGTIDAKAISDETLSKAVQDAIKYYDRFLELQNDSIENAENLSSIYVDMFENISSKYESMLNQLELNADLIDKSISMSEAQGYLTSTSFYNELITLENSKLSQLENKKSGLIRAMNEAVNSGEIEKYSSAWNDMQSEINDVTSAIYDSNLALLEYENTIRQLEWDKFDYLLDTISQIVDESDFLIDLMSNSDLFDKDTGKLTDEGMATLGLHGLNYNTYMEQAKKCAEEIKEIDEEIANDPYNTDLLERRQDLLESQRDNILAAEDEKQAIKDLVSEGIEHELDALDELIQKYKDALDSQEDLYEYQKNIKKQTSNIASLQKQLEAYANDTSEETKAKVQQLKVDLSDAEEELAETQHKQYISDAKKLLDNLYDKYAKNLNSQLDNIDGLIENVVADVNSNASNIMSTIQSVSGEVGYTLSGEMIDIWSPISDGTGAIQDVLTTYSNNMADRMTTLQSTVNNIVTGINDMVEASNNLANSYISAASSDSIENQTGSSSSSDTTATIPITTGNANNINNSSKKQTAKEQFAARYGSKTVYSSAFDGAFTTIPEGIAAANKVLNANNPVAYFMYKRGNKYTVRSVMYGDGAHSNDTGVVLGAYAAGTKYNKKKGNYLVDDGLGQELIEHKSNGRVISLEVGDRVFNADETNNLAENLENLSNKQIITPDGDVLTPLTSEDLGVSSIMASMFDLDNLSPINLADELLGINKGYPDVNNNTTNNTSTISIQNVNLPNVTNAEEFYSDIMKMAQKDKKFEKMIQSMTVDRAVGKSSLAKYKYKF